jgi:hypothetical protein
MSAAVSPPTAAPGKTDPATGFALMQQPIGIVATSPVLASGNPLMSPSASGPYTVDAGTAKAGFVFGVLFYQNLGGVVKIWDGIGSWIPETSFDPSSTPFKVTGLAFDQTTHEWKTIFVIAALTDAAAASFPTPASGTKYGFISVFTSPKVSPTTAVRSALGAPFGVTTSDGSQRVQPGLLQALASTQDATKADGFGITVNDKSGMTVADAIVSSDSADLTGLVMLRFHSGGVVRASVEIDRDGNIAVTSSGQVTIAAPVVTVTGTLHAQNIEYVPYGGSGSTFL